MFLLSGYRPAEKWFWSIFWRVVLSNNRRSSERDCNYGQDKKENTEADSGVKESFFDPASCRED